MQVRSARMVETRNPTLGGDGVNGRRSLQAVIDNDMCIGCGACVAADPSVRLHLDPHKLMYEPERPGGERAAAVCPGLAVDFEGLQRELFPGSEPTPLGVIDGGVYLAQSTDRQRNLEASSGGIIKELLRRLLARDDIDGIIALQHVEGLRYEPTLIRTPAEIDELPGSIYHSLNFQGALELLRAHRGRFVLVAIPCQLEGIFQYIFKCEPELRERIAMTIGLICGWTYSHHAVKAVCEYTGVNFNRLRDVTYRGGGPVGPLRLIEPNRETRVHRRISFNYQVAFDRAFNLPRCHLCIDHTNFLADIVVADAWLPSTVMTKTGISLVICRRRGGEEHLRALQREDRIKLLEVGPDEVEESQTHRVAYGDFAYAYADYLRRNGRFAPEMVGPNRQRTRLASDKDVTAFHENTTTKIRLQRAGRYRALRLRKIMVEFRPYARRYLRWFGVRVLRLKSLFGTRQELAREDLKGFR
jgi:coenzyme F420 hydrogenase subunit beta